MYKCKKCKSEFSLPVVEFAKSKENKEMVGYCPNCMSVDIEKIEVRYCAFCQRNKVSKGQKYCDEYCERLGEELEERLRIQQSLLSPLRCRLLQCRRALETGS